MNYGWDETSRGWKESRKDELIEALCKELPIADHKVLGGTSPYLEVDGLYPGVRLRRLTNLADDDMEEFVKRAEKIYMRVMGLKE
jgi:hypothetical protein